MRIVHFLYDCPENPWLGGGGAVRAQEINQRLVAKGHEVHMICGAFKSRENADWIVNGVHWHSCGNPKNYVKSRILFSLLCRKRFLSLCLNHTDLVVEDISPFSVILARRCWKGPIVTVIQNWMGPHLVKKLGILGHIFRVYEKFLMRSSRTVITVSKGLAAQITKIAPNVSVEVIYNGIQDAFFQFERETVPIIPHSFLFVGRIDIYQKGLDLLLNAFAKVRLEVPDAKLWIVGSGKDQEQLIKEISRLHLEDSVTLFGKLGEERIQRMAMADVVVMPSRFESWGIVALESAALGKPVIGTNIEGLNEAILDGETGVLVEDDNVVQYLINTMIQSCIKPDYFLNVKQKAIEHSRKFLWDHLSNQTEENFHRVVQNV